METWVIGIAHSLPVHHLMIAHGLCAAYPLITPPEDGQRQSISMILQIRFIKIHCGSTDQTLQICNTGLCICYDKGHGLWLVSQERLPLTARMPYVLKYDSNLFVTTPLLTRPESQFKEHTLFWPPQHMYSLHSQIWRWFRICGISNYSPVAIL